MATATKKAPKAPKETKVVELLPIQIEEFEIKVVGLSPLITHRFSEKAKKQIEDKQQKRAKEAKQARDPHEEFLSSTYPMPGHVAGVEGCKYGFPAICFKQAAIAACSYVPDLTKVMTRGAFHIMAPEGGLVELKYESMRRVEHPVTIGMGTRDMRYRAEFNNWSAVLKIRHNAGALSAEQICNLLNLGGFCSGVGEMRASQAIADQFGQFQVQTM